MSSVLSRSMRRIESCDAVISVYDKAGNVIDTDEHTGDFKEWRPNCFGLPGQRLALQVASSELSENESRYHRKTCFYSAPSVLQMGHITAFS
jgi:hypothetical protein